MEVAAPLTFPHTQAGTKRTLACSPGLMETTNLGLFTEGNNDHHDQYSQRFFKRRRFNSDEKIESLSEKFASSSPFSTVASIGRSPLTSHHGSLKRNRTVLPSQPQSNELLQVVEKQATEIEGLKKDKSELESSLEKLRTENDKVIHENKILKRAVTIQQDRQLHAATEMEAARQFKVDAEDKMKRMEQMIMYLRYHLQAQQPNAGNDFMGLVPRNPDVY